MTGTRALTWSRLELKMQSMSQKMPMRGHQVSKEPPPGVNMYGLAIYLFWRPTTEHLTSEGTSTHKLLFNA